MNVPKTDPNWQTNLIPKDRPTYYEVLLDEGQSLREAFANRPEYRQAKTALDSREIERMVARNQRLPELNIYGYYGFTGADESNSQAFDNMETLDFHHWQVGLEFRYPLPNRAGRYRYRQSQLQYDQSEQSLENLKNLITLGIRNSLREVETNRKRIDVTQTSVEYEEAKLDAEQKRFDVGMATSHDVLEFQRDLADSRANHLRAIIDYNKALIDLELAKGSLLQRHQIQIENE
jgi:outer membrane protein TolC